MAEIPELVEPEAVDTTVVVVKAVPQVGMVAILAVVLGMILAAEAICRAFFGTLTGSVGWIPFAGSVISSPIKKIEQKVISYLSGLEADIDGSMGHHIHQLAVLISQLWRTLENTASVLVTMATLLSPENAVYQAFRIIRHFVRELHIDGARITALEHTVTHTVHIITHTITRTIVKSAKVATVAVPKYIHRELLAIRHEARQAIRANVRQDKEISKLWRHVSYSAIAAVVASVVGKAALDAIKCSSLANAFKNRGCNFWRDLTGLLDVLGAIFLFDHFCDLWSKAEPLFALVLIPVVGVISTFADGACSHRPSSWETIGTPLSLPTPGEITQTLHTG